MACLAIGFLFRNGKPQSWLIVNFKLTPTQLHLNDRYIFSLPIMEFKVFNILVLDEHSDPRHSPLVDELALVIDKAAYVVYLGSDKITFPKKEFELLLLLASNPRKVFKRADILTSIWGPRHKPKDSRSLDVHIRMIRKKLKEEFITTVRGVGYRLEK
jgi:DNA-binding response OmpR family regulator